MRWRQLVVAAACGLASVLATTAACSRQRPSSDAARSADAWRLVAGVAAQATLRGAFTQLEAARSSRGPGDAGPVAMQAAINWLDRSFLSTRTPTLASQLALARAATGDPKACLDALALIEDADRTADVWADASGCEIERGTHEDSAYAFARALEAALRALALDARHLVALRNQRRALFALGLAPPADPDPSGPFALLRATAPGEDAPARQQTREVRLAALQPTLCDPSQALTDASVDLSREILMRCVMSEWASHILAGRATEAAAYATHAHALAGRLAAEVGDACFPRLVDDVVACVSGEDCLRRARGWRATAVAATAWDAEAYDTAAAQATMLRSATSGSWSVASAYAHLELARVEWWQQAAQSAEARLRGALAGAVPAGCVHVQGRARWALALLEFERADFDEAARSAQTAAEELDDSGDAEAHAVVSNVAAGIEREIEDFDTAWTFSRVALTHLWAARQAKRQSVLSGTASLAARSQLRQSAMFFRSQAIADARRSRATASLAFLLPERAQDLADLRSLDEAATTLDEAGALAPDLPTDTRLLADVPYALAFSAIHGTRRYAESRHLLESVITSQQARGMTFQLPRLYRQLALEAADAGDLPLVHRTLARVTAAEVRLDVAERLWTGGNEPAAVALMAPLVAADAAPGPSARRRLVLRFHVGRDAILALGHGPSGPIAFRVGRSSREVGADVTHVGRLMRQRRTLPDFNRYLGQLFDDLLGSVPGQLRDVEALVVRADGVLREVPFAALFDRRSGRYVLETVVVHHLGDERPRPDRTSRPAVIAGATTASQDGLAALPAAARELRSVAAGYGQARVIGDRAALLSALPSGGVFHFAGHAIQNAAHPERSMLVLAGRGGGPDAGVTAGDIARLRLAGLQLAVLNGCDTAAADARAGGSAAGLAAAFLDAGTSSVVATLWSVDDEEATSVSLQLHEYWRAGAGAAAATRHAQLALMQQHRDRPWTWAAFVAMHRPV